MFFRSALFMVSEKKNRNTQSVKNLPIISTKNIEITYSGFVLGQGDLDVFLHLVHLASKGDDDLVQCSMRDILKSIGRHHGKPNLDWLKDSIDRLKTSLIKIKFTGSNGRIIYGSSLVEKFVFIEEKKRYYIKLDKNIVNLFNNGWCYVDWEKRISLKRPLTKWLLGFIDSQDKNRIDPISVKRVKELCGSSTSRHRDFRRKIKISLEELKSIGAIESWSIDDQDNLHIHLPVKRRE